MNAGCWLLEIHTILEIEAIDCWNDSVGKGNFGPTLDRNWQGRGPTRANNDGLTESWKFNDSIADCHKKKLTDN